MSDTSSIPDTPNQNGYANGSSDPAPLANGNGRPLNGGGLNGQPPNGGAVRKKLMGYVGFANLPNQVHRKSVRKGFQFTAMVVGASCVVLTVAEDLRMY